MNYRILAVILVIILIIAGAVAFTYYATRPTNTQHKVTVTLSASSTVTIPATGEVVGVGLSVTPPSISVGTISYGSITKTNITVTNTGNLPETLSMTTTGLPSYLTLTWSYVSGTILAPQASLTITFTLTVSSSAPLQTFSFSISVTATQSS
jgi:hypothetical protein